MPRKPKAAAPATSAKVPWGVIEDKIRIAEKWTADIGRDFEALGAAPTTEACGNFLPRILGLSNELSAAAVKRIEAMDTDQHNTLPRVEDLDFGEFQGRFVRLQMQEDLLTSAYAKKCLRGGK